MCDGLHVISPACHPHSKRIDETCLFGSHCEEFTDVASPLRPQDLLEFVQAEFIFGQAVTLKAAAITCGDRARMHSV